MDLRRRERVAERPARNGQGIRVHEVAELPQHGGDPARMVKLFDEMLPGRAYVDQHRRAAGDLVEAFKGQRNRDAARDCEQVDHGVRPAADRHQRRDRVVERLGLQDPRRRQPFLREPDGPPAGRLGGSHAGGIDGGNGRAPGQAHPECLDNRRHRGCRPHLVAVADARRELGLRHPTGAQLVCVVPEVRAGAQLAPAEDRSAGRTAREHDRRHVRARRSHELSGHRLVAAADQDDGVKRIRADGLLDVHRHQVAIEHRRRLHQVLAERDRREFERQSACEQHAALHRLGKAPEVHVAVHELGPRVADSDHGPAGQCVVRQPLRVQGRAMNEAGQVVSTEPALATPSAHRTSIADNTVSRGAASSWFATSR